MDDKDNVLRVFVARFADVKCLIFTTIYSIFNHVSTKLLGEIITISRSELVFRPLTFNFKQNSITLMRSEAYWMIQFELKCWIAT